MFIIDLQQRLAILKSLTIATKAGVDNYFYLETR